MGIWDEVNALDLIAKDMKESLARADEIKKLSDAKRAAYREKLREVESNCLINNFHIGCDPEFVGVDSGKLVTMNNYFPEGGLIGTDHGGSVGEFRPKPAKYAWTLVHRLRTMMEDVKKKGIPGKLRAGAMVKFGAGTRSFVTLGGHVHVDLDPYDGVLGGGELHGNSVPWDDWNLNKHIKYVGYTAEWDQNSPVPQERSTWAPRSNVIISWSGVQNKVLSKEHKLRVAALDSFTSLLEHLDILPAKECQERRATSEYGKYGDVRISASAREVSSYNLSRVRPAPKYRMEYRTMASWLFDPIVTLLCLTGAKVASVNPQGTIEDLKGVTSFKAISDWLEKYADRDADCARLVEKYLPKGHKALVIDPGVDIRERWEGTK